MSMNVDQLKNKKSIKTIQKSLKANDEQNTLETH